MDVATSAEVERRVRQLAGWSMVGAVFLFSVSGTPTWSKDNRTTWEFATHKIPKSGVAIARAIAHHTEPDDLVLMPDSMSIFAVRIDSPPRFLAVRTFYLAHLDEFLDQKEINERVRMMRFVGEAQPRQSVDAFLDGLDKYCVTVVVTNRAANRSRPGLSPLLVKRGFEEHKLARDLAGTRLWRRDPEACEAQQR